MRLPLLGIQGSWLNRLVLRIQALVSAQPGPKLGYFRQCFVVGGPQLRCVGHAVQVADGAPGTA